MPFNEITGNMWSIEADAHCITTNGFVKKNGEAVMGAGCAKEAKVKFPGIAATLGHTIQTVGNRVAPLWRQAPYTLVSFPVKHKWWEAADPELIKQSARDLIRLADTFGWEKVILPRPGCGNGRLKWEDVKKVLEPILDERVYVVSKS